MAVLEIKAGRQAYKHIRRNGLQTEDVKAVVAAAGGPKWFTTYGLMRFILGDLLKEAAHPIQFLGSSVGSWQMACGLTEDPVQALDRLRDSYAGYIYSNDPGPEEISEACGQIIQAMLADQTRNILNHPSRTLHVITARGKGWLSASSKWQKGIGFGWAWILNAFSRGNINQVVDRVVFSNKKDLPYDHEADLLSTSNILLSAENLLHALRASGAIPFLMKGINDISGSRVGSYWDGGITDYHISLPFKSDGIVLNPHFLPYVLEGWLDKKLPWTRIASRENMSNVLLIHPSKEYVNTLPRKQISDLRDFYHYGEDQEARINYWSEISERSLELGAYFKELIESGNISSVIQPY